MSNQTKLLDDILYQELRPWLGKTALIKSMLPNSVA